MRHETLSIVLLTFRINHNWTVEIITGYFASSFSHVFSDIVIVPISKKTLKERYHLTIFTALMASSNNRRAILLLAYHHQMQNKLKHSISMTHLSFQCLLLLAGAFPLCSDFVNAFNYYYFPLYAHFKISTRFLI